MIPLMALMLAFAAGDSHGALPRIGVHSEPGSPGHFVVRDTGERFQPRGFNHTVLGGEPRWHATFNAGMYDPEAMEAALAHMAALGANTVRVWIWGNQDAGGFTGEQTALGINGDYVDNVVDFLRRATRHDIYVFAVLDGVPRNATYLGIVQAHQQDGKSPFQGYNAHVLDEGWIAAKAQAIGDFVEAIKVRDPALLSTVLGWSFSNEQFLTTRVAPFNQTEGMITPVSGKSYDLAVPADRRACADDCVLIWANRLTAALKEADPDALATVGMWTADAHDRQPDNGLPIDGKDPRFPPRPSVLGGPDSDLDFLGVHIYPWDGTSRVSADHHERDVVIATGTPVLVGEYGVFRHRNTVDEARVMLREMLEQAYAMGYAGDLFWIWDLRHIEYQTYSAVEHDLGGFVMQLPLGPDE